MLVNHLYYIILLYSIKETFVILLEMKKKKRNKNVCKKFNMHKNDFLLSFCHFQLNGNKERNETFLENCLLLFISLSISFKNNIHCRFDWK